MAHPESSISYIVYILQVPLFASPLKLLRVVRSDKDFDFSLPTVLELLKLLPSNTVFR